MQALADQIQGRLGAAVDPLVENFTAHGKLIWNPTPPAVDVYPGDPFMEPLSMGKGRIMYYLTVRARVSTADNVGGQALLLSLMDPTATTSLTQAIEYDRDLGGKVGQISVQEGPSAYGVFGEVAPSGELSQGALIGAVWRCRVIP